MTNKDLNLALDQNLIQPARPQNETPYGYSSHDHGTDDDNIKTDYEADNLRDSIRTSMHPKQTEQRKKKTSDLLSYLPAWLTGTIQQPFVWLPIMANLFFLIIAVFWLSHQNPQPDNITHNVKAIVEEDTRTNIEPIKEQLLQLQQQLDQITVSLHEQQRLIATSSQDLNVDIQDVAQQVQTLNAIKTTTNKPGIVVSKKAEEAITPTKGWHVNLGTFSTKDAALRLQKKLLALGHSAQINTTTFDNKTAYRVQLPGFNDRDSAEKGARRIMDETNLNGLWAWKDE